MTDDEKEVIKAGAEAAMKPFATLLERLFGGSVEEIGGMWQDSLKMRRLVRRLRLFKEMKRQLDEAHFEPEEIPEKIWIPALQYASLEDSETLCRRWAALLKNASDPKADVEAVYVTMLAGLSHNDAVALDQLFDEANSESVDESHNLKHVDPLEVSLGEPGKLVAFVNKATGSWSGARTIDNLVRLGILEVRRTAQFGDDRRAVALQTSTDVYFTALGVGFVRSCSPDGS